MNVGQVIRLSDDKDYMVLNKMNLHNINYLYLITINKPTEMLIVTESNNNGEIVSMVRYKVGDGIEKREAIMTAGRTRLRPVLMTALTTVLAMSTMTMGGGMGADLSKPMAIVTIGGLTYGTLLTLYVVPCIYDIFNREKKSKVK